MATPRFVPCRRKAADVIGAGALVPHECSEVRGECGRLTGDQLMGLAVGGGYLAPEFDGEFTAGIDGVLADDIVSPLNLKASGCCARSGGERKRHAGSGRKVKFFLIGFRSVVRERKLKRRDGNGNGVH